MIVLKNQRDRFRHHRHWDKMKERIILGCLMVVLFLAAAGFKQDEQDVVVKKITANFLEDKYLLDQKINELSSLVNSPGTLEEKKDSIKAKLIACRNAYKKTEWIISYYYPTLAVRINGPDVIEEEEPTEFEPAHGLQVIENALAGDLNDSFQLNKIHTELNYLQLTTTGLTSSISLLVGTSPGVILVALKYELIKIAALGFTEYDNPVEKNYLTESVIALQSVREGLRVFDPQIQATLAHRKNVLFNKTILFIQGNNDVEKFDRLTFIVTYYKPLSKLVNEYVAALKLSYSSYNSCVDISRNSIFDITSFDHYISHGPDSTFQARILLGQTLFFDPVLSGNGKRACASCHQPEKAFTDGLAKSLAFEPGESVTRNAPTILNVCLQTTFFDDSRELSLERQIIAVVTNPKELNSNFQTILLRLKQSNIYKQMFQLAFPGDSISTRCITMAIADYERSLVGFNSSFDQYIKGNKSKLTHSQINGFNLFMGKAKCGGCHFLPLFNGVLPPFYNKSDFEVIGALQSNDFKNPQLDTDEGIGAINKTPHQKFGFKVPGLRNVQLTAPYMHNGSLKTLTEVLIFYNKGGASGFGIKLPNQTLSADSLGLSKEQMEDVVHFLESLTDTTGLLPRSHILPVLSANEKINTRKVGGEY
jgi:cytochrome c peroxidase